MATGGCQRTLERSREGTCQVRSKPSYKPCALLWPNSPPCLLSLKSITSYRFPRLFSPVSLWTHTTLKASGKTIYFPEIPAQSKQGWWGPPLPQHSGAAIFSLLWSWGNNLPTAVALAFSNAAWEVSRPGSLPHQFSLLSRDLLLAPALPEYSVMKKVITMKGSGVAFGAIISSLMGKNTDALG